MTSKANNDRLRAGNFAFRWLRFLRWFCPSDLYEGIEGDILEQFEADMKASGLHIARANLRWNIIRFFRPAIILRNRLEVSLMPAGMLANYIKMAWRTLLGNRTYAVINFTGLTLGISIAIVLFWIVRFESGFDGFHKNSDRLYQIISHNKFGEPNSHVPQGVIYALREEFPEVEDAATVYGFSPQVLRVGDRNVKGETCFFIHPEFLRMIDVQWIRGSAETSLRDIYQVVLDEPTARKFFGESDPLGKTIRYDNTLDLVVSGVIARMPINSEFQFPMIMSYETLTRVQSNFTNHNNWGGGDSWCHGYVLLKRGADLASVEERLASMLQQHKSETNYAAFRFVLLSQAHFYQYNDSFNYGIPSWMVQALSGIALFLVVIAIINFVNLSTAQAAQRGREIGMRKVMGGNRLSIVIQFFTETAVTVIFSVVAASLLATQLIAFAGEFFNTQAARSDVWDSRMVGYLMVLTCVVTFLAGCYPALLLSGVKPLKIFQGETPIISGRGVSLRKSLVVVQFVLAQVMVICMVIGRGQMEFFYRTDPGFETEAIVTVDMPYKDSVLLQQRFRKQLLQHPEIQSVTYALTSPSSDRNWWWGDTHYAGLLNGEQTFRLQWIDHNYLDFYRIKLLAGRNFNEGDTMPMALINQKAVEAMGLKTADEALGEKLKYWRNNEVTVIGVVDNYYSQGFKSEIPPHLYMNGDWNFQMAQIKVDSRHTASAIDIVQKYWTEMHPENYFEYHFLSDELKSFYEDERKFSNFIMLFSALGITIGCLGLFGLVSFICVRRSKEISIRKVLGATLSNVITLLSKDFLLLVFISFILAVPLGWVLMTNFLQRYTYHIEITWVAFGLAGVATITLALLTVIIRSLSTARENPVEKLKCE